MRFLNPCKFDIQTLIPVQEPVVIDAELMKNRRLKVPDVNRIFHNIVRKSSVYTAGTSLEVQLPAQLHEPTKLNR